MKKNSSKLRRQLTKATIAVVFVLSFILIIVECAPAVGGLNTSITLSTTQGPVSTPVVVTGQGFTVNTLVTITFDSMTVTYAKADMSGRIVNTSPFLIPYALEGLHTVKATSETGEVASATFTVGRRLASSSPSTSSGTSTTSKPTSTAAIRLSSGQGSAGTSVGITGSGFSAGSTVSVTFDGKAMSSTSADSSGNINLAVTIPLASSGAHSITATGTGGKYATAWFTIAQPGMAGNGANTTQHPAAVQVAEFWSPTTVILLMIAAAVAFTVPTVLIIRRRGSVEPILEEKGPQYGQGQSYQPVQQTRTSFSQSPYQPGLYSQRKPTQTTSYYSTSRSSMQPMRRLGAPSGYSNRPSPSRYSQQQSATKLCRYCRKTVREDMNVCPYCRKRLR